MNEEKMQAGLREVLPPRLFDRVAWVFERQYWDTIVVAFYIDPALGVRLANIKIVNIPKADWLNDAAIARICFEAP
jgi:hypothetical protein